MIWMSRRSSRDPARLGERLAVVRARAEVRRAHRLARRAARIRHALAISEVREQRRAHWLARRDRARTQADLRQVGRLYQRAMVAGTRAYLATQIRASAEARALRLSRLMTLVLAVGLPTLLMFGAWSTTGVQAGVAALLDLDRGSAGWWAAWLVEPAIITIVAGIIVATAVLRSAGGDIDARASRIKWGTLAVSIALNGAGVLTAGGEHLTWGHALVAVAAHSIGPVGAAVTAYLIGVLVDYITSADPYRGATRLADLDLELPSLDRVRQVCTVDVPSDLAPTGHDTTDSPASDRTGDRVDTQTQPEILVQVPDRVPDWLVAQVLGDPRRGGGVAVIDPHRRLTGEVSEGLTGEVSKGGRSTGDRRDRRGRRSQSDRARRGARADRSTARTARTLDDLVSTLDRLVAAGELPADPSTNAVRQRLQCGTARAREARGMWLARRGERPDQ